MTAAIPEALQPPFPRRVLLPQAITSPADVFKCIPYQGCIISAESCVRRRLRAEENAGFKRGGRGSTAKYQRAVSNLMRNDSKCVGCEIGELVERNAGPLPEGAQPRSLVDFNPERSKKKTPAPLPANVPTLAAALGIEVLPKKPPRRAPDPDKAMLVEEVGEKAYEGAKRDRAKVEAEERARTAEEAPVLEADESVGAEAPDAGDGQEAAKEPKEGAMPGWRKLLASLPEAKNVQKCSKCQKGGHTAATCGREDASPEYRFEKEVFGRTGLALGPVRKLRTEERRSFIGWALEVKGFNLAIDWTARTMTELGAGDRVPAGKKTKALEKPAIAATSPAPKENDPPFKIHDLVYLVEHPHLEGRRVGGMMETPKGWLVTVEKLDGTGGERVRAEEVCLVDPDPKKAELTIAPASRATPPAKGDVAIDAVAPVFAEMLAGLPPGARIVPREELQARDLLQPMPLVGDRDVKPENIVHAIQSGSHKLPERRPTDGMRAERLAISELGDMLNHIGLDGENLGDAWEGWLVHGAEMLGRLAKAETKLELDLVVVRTCYRRLEAALTAARQASEEATARRGRPKSTT